MLLLRLTLAYILIFSVTAIAKQNTTPKGKQLIAKSACMGCHTEKAKLLGPSYADIALKYPANSKNISLLASRIISGSKGVWGNVPMIPHPKISKADAEEMVKYILTIKK